MKLESPNPGKETLTTINPDAASPERLRIVSLDEEADIIHGLRSSIASLYPKISTFLPRTDDGKKIYLDGVVRELNNGKELDELISWGDTLKGNTIENDMKRDEIRATFQVAVAKQRELEKHSGNFNYAEPDNTGVTDYYKYRFGEFTESIQKVESLEDQLDLVEEKIRLARQRCVEKSETPQSVYVNLTKKYLTERKRLISDLEEVSNTPEGHLYLYGRRLHQMQESVDSGGRIIETPYVASRIQFIKEAAEEGRPVFIHGELGSGKTELAKHVARKLSLQKWIDANPKPTEPKMIEEWERKKTAMIEPLIIPGHRFLEPEVFTAARTIERGESIRPEDQITIINERWEKFAKEHPDLKDESIKRTFEEAYREMFKSPIEVKVALGPLFRAMKEGRPVIIDEINAIPHYVLIVLNDLLLTEPGKTITPPIPGAEQVTVEEGFCVIATGNYKPEDGAMYIGRQPVDAAFLSRFKLLEYDFLPNKRSMEPPGLTPEESREWRANNELMMMMVVSLMDGDISLTAPENTFEQLEKLAYVARNLQDVFSGKKVDAAWNGQTRTGANVPPQDILKENVLSIRHLIPILKKWKQDGYTRTLDHYIFSEYIARSGARPEEKTYLYKTLKIMGDFFSDGNMWPDVNDRQGILEFDPVALMYKTDPSTGRLTEQKNPDIPVGTFPPIEVIKAVFGPVPERKVAPAEFLTEVYKGSQKDEKAQEEMERAHLADEIGNLFEGLV